VTSLSRGSIASEAYRSLRSSIGFAGIDAPIRRLQITSASKGVGKSTTAANLAIAMAIDRKRVILIDADLRAPTVHRLFQTAASPGLSEVLAEMNSLAEALQPTEVEGLWVIPAGVIPPNPAELLGSSAFDHLLEHLEQQADVLIFDTPPCMPVTDPLIVAARMDAVVLVLKVGYSRKGALRQTVELLGRARARVIGMVLNQVDASRRGSYYYRQYTEYRHGYRADAEQPGGQQRRNGKGSKPPAEQTWTVAAPSRGPEEDA
jgi:capsular exopolysaccharide synthesis family protein